MFDGYHLKTVGSFGALACQLRAISVNVNKSSIRHHRASPTLKH